MADLQMFEELAQRWIDDFKKRTFHDELSKLIATTYLVAAVELQHTVQLCREAHP